MYQGSHAVLKYWKSIESWNRFSRPWKSMEFGHNVCRALKKNGNSNRKKKSLSFWAESSLIALISLNLQAVKLQSYFYSNFMGHARVSNVYDCARESIEDKLGYKIIKSLYNFHRWPQCQ